jgi:dipeptidyl aminopeptidase/acylaminoacyl peptidase
LPFIEHGRSAHVAGASGAGVQAAPDTPAGSIETTQIGRGGVDDRWFSEHHPPIVDTTHCRRPNAGYRRITGQIFKADAIDYFAGDLGGRLDQIPDIYRERSPLTYAACCTALPLLLHGNQDMRCPLAEAEQFYRALRDAGCATELVIVPGMTPMGGSIGPVAARRVQNEALLEWFERHL